MRKITFVITSPEYLRYYIQSNVLNYLMKSNEIRFIIKNSISTVDFGVHQVNYYIPDKKLHLKRRFVFDVLMYKFRSHSSSFGFRIKRRAAFQIMEWISIRKPKDLLRILFRVSQRLYHNISCYFLSLLPISVILSSLNVDKTDKNFENAILSERPDIVIFPSSAHSPEDIDIVLICRKHRIVSFLLADNWDNLSSKSILLHRPNYVGVWGDQSKSHAVNIQGFSPDQVFLLGTARFSDYFLLRQKNIKSHFDHPYVLFLGTAVAFDEISALKRLEEEIEHNYELYGASFKIIYRPHPWRQGTDHFHAADWKHIILDPQVAEAYLTKKHGQETQPSLSYYPSLISNSLFIIGGLTSMLIESQIFYKKYIGLVYPERFSITSPDKVFREYTHFRGLENIKTVKFCHSLDDFPTIFRDTFHCPQVDNKLAIDNSRQYFLFDDGQSYSNRLADIISSITPISPMKKTVI